MKNILLATLVLLFVTGCANTTNTTINENKNIVYGKKPNMKKYNKIIITKVKNNLKDPYSAKIYNFIPPVRATMYKSIGGWITMFSVNAKNSFGAYSGAKTYGAFIAYSTKTKGNFLLKVAPLSDMANLIKIKK